MLKYSLCQNISAFFIKQYLYILILLIMSTKYLNIPSKIKVGFKYTYDKLSYITYMKADGTIAKEVSWNNWRDKNIPELDFDNIPTTGFKVKDYGGSHKWSSRLPYCQIVDPRGFEFQISYENLMFIILTDNVINGEIQGEYVFGWDNTTLILTSVKCEDYLYTTKINNSDQRFDPKDCIVGHTYYMPKEPNKELIYIGCFPYVNTNYRHDHWGYDSKYIFKPIMYKKYIFKVANTDIYEYLNPTITHKLVCKSNNNIDTNIINTYIQNYLNTQTTNPDNLTSKKISSINKFKLYNTNIKDITDEIISYKEYPVAEWTDEFLMNQPANLFNKHHIWYISNDNKTIYKLSIYHNVYVNNNVQSYQLFQTHWYNNRYGKTDEEKLNSIRKYGTYKLDIDITYSITISQEDNVTMIGRYVGNNNIIDLSKGRIILTDKSYFRENFIVLTNDNRELKLNIYL